MNETTTFSMPRVIAWEITRRCPLKCRHCRAGAMNLQYENELTTEECLRVIDSLAEAKPMIIWTGGEPMLRADILDLIAHAREKGLRSVLAPCGSLVTAERLTALRDAGITACSFSLDGPDEASHDTFRGVPGAYRNITRAMNVARSIGLPFQINVTVSTLNYDQLDAIHARAVELGAAKLDLFFLVPVGRGRGIADLALNDAQRQTTLDWAFRKAQEGPIAIKETCCPQAPAYHAEWLRAHPEANPAAHRPCGCLGGRGFAFLSHTGALQTCGFIETPCGNIRDYGLDFPALIAAAVNPLGRQGNCRTI